MGRSFREAIKEPHQRPTYNRKFPKCKRRWLRFACWSLNIYPLTMAKAPRKRNSPAKKKAVVPGTKKHPNNRGRKGLYDKGKVLALVKALPPEQSRDYSIYSAIGIGHNTFYEWMKDDRKPEFRDAVLKKRAQCIDAIVNAQIKRATGYTYTVKRTMTKVDKDGGTEETEEVKEIHHAPSTAAAQLILYNKRPEEFSREAIEGPPKDIKIVTMPGPDDSAEVIDVEPIHDEGSD